MIELWKELGYIKINLRDND